MLHYLPISVFVVFNFTFLSTYIAAVAQNHVVPFLPYISDTGTYPPESCFFSLMLNIGSILLLLTSYTRYLQIYYLNEKSESLRRSIGKLNILSLILGITTCLGIQLVGNFQETNLLPAHYSGALLSFAIGTAYLASQTIMSFYLKPHLWYRFKHHIRLVLSLLCVVFLAITITFGAIAHTFHNSEKKGQWTPDQPGWKAHVVSTISEWALAITFSFYILTFVNDFRSIQYHPIRITLMAPPDDIDILIRQQAEYM